MILFIRMSPTVICADGYRVTPATTGDRILAGVLTSLVSVGSIGFAAWLAI